MKKTLLCVIIILGLLWLPSCDPQGREKKTVSGKTIIVTTFLPVYDICTHVGGDEVQVINLLPPGASPHTYEPTPQDSIAIEKAAVIFKIGLGADDWVDRLAVGGVKGKTVVAICGGVKTIPLPETVKFDNHKGHKHDHNHKHKKDTLDPHVWMDPLRMKTMAANVRDYYIKLMPGRKEIFHKNFNTYVKALETLDRKYSSQLGRFKKKEYVTFHSFMGYMAKRYDMDQAAVIVGFPGKKPDPKHVAGIIEILKKHNVKTVFAEPQFSDRASEAIAREINGKVMFIDPVGSLADPKRNTYIKNMEENLRTLTKAFREQNER